MKCLVVDDSSSTRGILAHTLRTIGFEHVVEAADGRDAFAACDADTDIVVTDWNMPQVDGLEFVRKLRADPRYAGLPVLLVTSRSLKDDMLEAARVGVDGYLVKPFTPETLRAKLEEVFALRGHDGGATGTNG